MDIVSNTTKEAMLQQLSDDMIPDGISENFIYFTDSNDVILGKLPFDDIATENTQDNPQLTFLRGVDNSNLEGTVLESGRVVRFFVVDGSDGTETGDKIISGLVGTPADVAADIKFNRVDWVKRNGIELSNVAITLENVCLHQ